MSPQWGQVAVKSRAAIAAVSRVSHSALPHTLTTAAVVTYLGTVVRRPAMERQAHPVHRTSGAASQVPRYAADGASLCRGRSGEPDDRSSGHGTFGVIGRVRVWFWEPDDRLVHGTFARIVLSRFRLTWHPKNSLWVRPQPRQGTVE